MLVGTGAKECVCVNATRVRFRKVWENKQKIPVPHNEQLPELTPKVTKGGSKRVAN